MVPMTTENNTETAQFTAAELRGLANRMGPLDVVTVTVSERISNTYYARPTLKGREAEVVRYSDYPPVFFD